MRATIAMAGPLAISARATKDPGHRADSEDIQLKMWLLITRTPPRLQIGLPNIVIRTPKQRSTNRQYARCACVQPSSVLSLRTRLISHDVRSRQACPLTTGVFCKLILLGRSADLRASHLCGRRNRPVAKV